MSDAEEREREVEERKAEEHEADLEAETPYYIEVCQTHEVAGFAASVLSAWLANPLLNLVASYLRIDPRVIRALFTYEPYAVIYMTTTDEERRSLFIGIDTDERQYLLTTIYTTYEPNSPETSDDIASIVLTSEELWSGFMDGDKLATRIEAEPVLYPDELPEKTFSQCKQYTRRAVMELIGEVHKLACGSK